MKLLVIVIVALTSAVPTTALPNCFLSMGDWGHQTSNTTAIGVLMEAAVADPSTVGCATIDFIFALGDNFYNKGVSSVDDPQWNTTFRQQFRVGSLQDALYYPVLGNHDYSDFNHNHTANRSQGLNQVAYYYERDPKWFLPAPNHTIYRTFNVASTGPKQQLVVAFVVIDSEAIFLCSHNLPPSWDCGHLSWLNDTLNALDSNSSVDHVVVAMHHCLASPVGGHPDPVFDAAVIPVLRSHRVSFTLAGHAHFVSWAKEELILAPFGRGEMWYITNGAARGDDPYDCSWEGESNLTIANLEEEVCQPAIVNDIGAFLLHRVFDTYVEHVVIMANGTRGDVLNTSYRMPGPTPNPPPVTTAPSPQGTDGDEDNTKKFVIAGAVAAAVALAVAGSILVYKWKRSARRQIDRADERLVD